MCHVGALSKALGILVWILGPESTGARIFISTRGLGPGFNPGLEKRGKVCTVKLLKNRSKLIKIAMLEFLSIGPNSAKGHQYD